MEHYELLYIISANYTSDELEPMNQKIRQVINEQGGTITHEQLLRKQKLAYPIKQVVSGYFMVTEFDAERETIKKMDNELALDTNIVRHMMIMKAKKTPEQIKREQMIYAKLALEEKSGQVEKVLPLSVREIPKIVEPIKVLEPEVVAVAADEPKVSETPEQEEIKLEATPVKKQVKVSLEELDKKLDEILDEEIL